jgi:molecular chaperone GrpE
MDEAVKEQLIERFRAYLDATDSTGAETLEAVDAQAPKAAPDAEPEAEAAAAPDLFSLLAEMAALKNEVKLESRQFKGALDQFRELFDTLRDANARIADEQQQRGQQAQAAAQQKQKTLLLELLDLRDRMQAGHDQCLRFRPGWFGGRRAAPFIASMAEGMAMNLRRLDETLSRRGVRPLPVLEQRFDPHSMHATELTADPNRAAGLVVAELRKGFLLNGELLRAAEVAVNRPRPDPAPISTPISPTESEQ